MATDKKLSGLAESGINQIAAAAAHPHEQGELVTVGANGARKGAAKAKASRR
jgi:hypothetical protein